MTNEKVLIVDDQQANRILITELVESLGLSTYPAPNGYEGLKLLYKVHPDLIVTDLCMPRMNGYEFSRLVRSICNTPIVVFTAMGQMTDQPHDMSMVDDYIEKPVDIDEFKTKINALLSGRRDPLPKLRIA